MIDIQKITSPVLTAGVINVTFGQFEKVTDAMVKIENPETNDYAFDTSFAISGNVVAVTVKKTQISSATPTWAAALTADVNNMDLTVVVKGE